MAKPLPPTPPHPEAVRDAQAARQGAACAPSSWDGKPVAYLTDGHGRRIGQVVRIDPDASLRQMAHLISRIEIRPRTPVGITAAPEGGTTLGKTMNEQEPTGSADTSALREQVERLRAARVERYAAEPAEGPPPTHYARDVEARIDRAANGTNMEGIRHGIRSMRALAAGVTLHANAPNGSRVVVGTLRSPDGAHQHMTIQLSPEAADAFARGPLGPSSDLRAVHKDYLQQTLSELYRLRGQAEKPARLLGRLPSGQLVELAGAGPYERVAPHIEAVPLRGDVARALDLHLSVARGESGRHVEVDGDALARLTTENADLRRENVRLKRLAGVAGAAGAEPTQPGPGWVQGLRDDLAALTTERDDLRERLARVESELGEVTESRNRNKSRGKAAARRVDKLLIDAAVYEDGYAKLCDAMGLDASRVSYGSGIDRAVTLIRESAAGGLTREDLDDWVNRVLGAAKVMGGGEGDRVVLFAHSLGPSGTPGTVHAMMRLLAERSGGTITPVVCPAADYVWIEDVRPLTDLRDTLNDAIAYLSEPSGDSRGRGVKLGNPAMRIAERKRAAERARSRAVGRLDGLVQSAAAVAGLAGRGRGIGLALPAPDESDVDIVCDDA